MPWLLAVPRSKSISAGKNTSLFSKWLVMPMFGASAWISTFRTLDLQAQFVSALVLGVRALIYGCDFPLWMQYALVVYMSSFLFLFGQYYRNAYLLKKQVTL
jgi:hypothetical protein